MTLGLDKCKIARRFRRSLSTYDDAALVQKKLAERLVGSLNSLPEKAFRRVIEIGCGTGILTEMLCSSKAVGTLYLNDLVPDCEKMVLDRIADQRPSQVIPFFGDIEQLAFPSDLSLIVSGSTFQWLNDFPQLLDGLCSMLPQGAFLAFTLFGSGTLKEFSSLTSVELTYYSDQKIRAMLDQAFTLESHSTYQDRLFFGSAREILHHIRATGVGGVGNYHWTKASLRDFGVRYGQKFGSKKGLPVSYVSSAFVFRKR